MQLNPLPLLFFSLSLPALALTSAIHPIPILPRTFGFWTIKNLTRSCPDPKICAYDFVVSTSSGDQPCSVIDTGMPALNHSFYGVYCHQAPNWQISWGWDYSGDFTVMTAVKINQPNGANLEAFFGYKSPNANIPATGGNASYADVGPNSVQQQ